MMPNSLRDSISLTGSISGKQQIYKYEPKRFSLAIRRHRKELKLVTIRYLNYNTFYVDCGDFYPFTSCGKKDANNHNRVFVDTLTFSSETRVIQQNQFKLANDSKGYYGYDFKNYDDNYLDITVFTVTGWENFLKQKGNEKFNQPTIDDIEDNEYNSIMKSSYSIWNLSKVNKSSEGFIKMVSPVTDGLHSTGPTYQYLANNNLGCQSNSSLDSVCVESDSKYDMNANLLQIDVNPGSNGKYYAGYSVINETAGNYSAYTSIEFIVTYTIPNTYWDADFGMDNLVNRTVRFDHTNKTIYGNGSDGYLNALESLGKIGDGTFYDGNEWKVDKNYGLLTPFEIQRLPMFSATELQGGLNTFLFADEDPAHSQDARLDMHFYGNSEDRDYFQATIIGKNVNVFSNSDSVVQTPYYSGLESLNFFVVRNMDVASLKTDSIDYPAEKDWVKTDSCSNSSQSWNFASDGTEPCYKYYEYGSRIHYYLDDYTDSVWQSYYVHDRLVRNMVNTIDENEFHENDFHENDFDTLLIANKSDKGVMTFSVKPRSLQYKDRKFFITIDSVTRTLSSLASEHVNALFTPLKIDTVFVSKENSGKAYSSKNDSLHISNDTLYVDAERFTRNFFYRRTVDSLATEPIRPQTSVLPMSRIYSNRDYWIKNIVIDSAKLLQLDSNVHSHLTVNGNFPDSSDLKIQFKSADSIKVKRPKELVELRAYLDTKREYRVVYLNDSAYYTLPNSSLDAKWKNGIKLSSGDSCDIYRLGWFDVNKLQGNTQFMLLWSDSGKTSYYYAKFEMVVGKSVNTSSSSTVKSLFGEVSVTFPKNALTENKDVTVRTIEAKDYPFDVFNNLALKGPVLEVLPSMTFENSAALPRIQMKISREELQAMNATPQTIKLYKVDFANKKFVPLENILYGYLKKDGHALVSTQSDTAAICLTAMDSRCYSVKQEWEYLLISAETHTFSVFTALDSSVAETPSFSAAILPEIASTDERFVRVDGLSRYRLYVDNDSIWTDGRDSTPPERLTFVADSNGFARVILPNRGANVDTNYVFVVALDESDSNGMSNELPAAPAFAKALTVNAEFACSVPSDSLWLGLDNGYMAYAAYCNHPGYGSVSLYLDNRLVVEQTVNNPDTLVYDGYKTVGSTNVGKIASGVYESRYRGISALGQELQMAGPMVYTDSARPVIEDWNVADSSNVLDRIFAVRARVTDSESGIANVTVSPVWGQDTLNAISVIPDSIGNVQAQFRLSRKKLSECSGCRLSLVFRVEDYGHNFSELSYRSDKIYPFPTEISLWYPSYEGSGKFAHELIGTGHNLNLSDMHNPWGSDVGLYLGHYLDSASGVGYVDLGETNAYTFELRMKTGYSNYRMRRVLGFKGSSGLNIELQNRGKVLCLAENSNRWCSPSIMPGSKEWTHVAVTMDSNYVRFYVDGEIAYSADVSNSAIAHTTRELYGRFSVGNADSISYIGNISDIRMYKKALSADEVYALSIPVTEGGDEAHTVVVAVNDMDIVDGFSKQFSCSIPGNHALVSNGTDATATMNADVEYDGRYSVMLYARSSTLSNAPVAIGAGTGLLSGSVALSSTWRAVRISGVVLDLTAGIKTISLKLPAGVQIGGLALVSGTVASSTIAWGKSSGSLEDYASIREFNLSSQQYVELV